MDRRSFLVTGATVALLPLTEAPAFAIGRTGTGDARLNGSCSGASGSGLRQH